MWKDSTNEFLQKLTKGLTILFLTGALSGLIESLIGVGGRSRLIDLTGILLERPLFFALFAVWLVIAMRLFRVVSWTYALERISSWIPFLLVIPLVNGLVTVLGLETTTPSFVNVLEAPVSLLTLGWLPRLLASPGALFGLLFAALLLGIDGWRVKEPMKRVVGRALIWLLGGLFLLLLPSLIAWLVVSAGASPLNAGPNVLARTWTALSQEGYWWRSTVDRFPGVLEGEATASVRFLQLSLVFLLLFGGAIFVVLRITGSVLRQMMAWFKPVRLISFLGMAMLGLAIGHLGGPIFRRGIDLVPLLLFIIVLLATWGVSVWRNDLHDQIKDQQSERIDRPLLSQRQLTVPEFNWIGGGLFLVVLIGGWLLGWPVLLPLLVFLGVQEGLAAEGIRLKERSLGGVLLALSSVTVMASGVFFVLQTAAVPVLRPGIWLALFAFCLFQSVPKALRWSPNLLNWFSTRTPIAPRMVIPISLALSYLVLPLLAGWAILWWIAIPCAFVSLIPLLGNGRWDERKMVGWQTAFLVVSCLLLSLRLGV
jgi:4-hydroxybenzoate polyprenyltransferase